MARELVVVPVLVTKVGTSGLLTKSVALAICYLKEVHFERDVRSFAGFAPLGSGKVGALESKGVTFKSKGWTFAGLEPLQALTPLQFELLPV